MLRALADLVRPALFALDPERAHELTLLSLERGLYPRDAERDDPILASTLGTLQLPNPVGIAAGFDKDGRVPDAVLALGCGFAEIGTVTPLPQAGNPKPRIFRLISERAVARTTGAVRSSRIACAASPSDRSGGSQLRAFASSSASLRA